ncbi:GMC family oxidoreductase N-terminal domain-containing protein [bacterium]|nr:GMC family oxidoreductase N-terminal domain-containing protein [bacterium]
MANKINLSADVIIVGSGPGGATVAKYLADSGKKILLFERGRDHRNKWYYGTYPGAMLYSEKMSLLFTKEGLNIIAPNMLGGATSMFAGCAAPPPSWLKDKYGLDLDKEVAETVQQLNIQPLAEKFRGKASTRIAESAGKLGYDWYAQPKFMTPARTKKGEHQFKCGASCMLGCACGAKWNAAEWVDDAVASQVNLRTRANISKVLIQNGTVTGVEGHLQGKKFTAEADTVILSAGGLGSPRILQRSGFKDAGVGMTMDTTVMVYGFTKYSGTGMEPPMTWSWENDDAGYMLSTLTDPWLLYPLVAIRKGIGPAIRWLQWHKMLGIMIKLKDDVAGGVFPDGSISKPLTKGDEESLKHAENICHKILLEAGAKKETIFMTPQRGTHPSGTVRVGELLDKNLQTSIKGLYVCDASVFPESLDRPTVLTIIGLGKRLAKHLLAMD